MLIFVSLLIFSFKLTKIYINKQNVFDGSKVQNYFISCLNEWRRHDRKDADNMRAVE